MALALLAFAVSYSYLPERVPVHWNVAGVVDGYGSRYALLLLGPGLMLAELALFAVLPRLSPRRYGIDAFRSTYDYLMLLVVALTGYLFAVLLWAALLGSVDIHRSILGGISVLVVLMGNVLGKVRRNFFIGIRTPWTLASERVWYATHRLAAKCLVVSGIIALVLALLGTAFWLWMTVFGIGMLLPVVYSLIYYKQLEKRGELF